LAALDKYAANSQNPRYLQGVDLSDLTGDDWKVISAATGRKLSLSSDGTIVDADRPAGSDPSVPVRIPLLALQMAQDRTSGRISSGSVTSDYFKNWESSQQPADWNATMTSAIDYLMKSDAGQSASGKDTNRVDLSA
jgi:hypothetical protein